MAVSVTRLPLAYPVPKPSGTVTRVAAKSRQPSGCRVLVVLVANPTPLAANCTRVTEGSARTWTTWLPAIVPPGSGTISARGRTNRSHRGGSVPDSHELRAMFQCVAR